MPDKPSLLYISPVVPLLTGNGLAMRAGMVLELLARSYRVWLLVVPHYPPFAGPIPDELAVLCEETHLALPPGVERESPPRSRRRPFGGRREADVSEAGVPYQNRRFDVVHIFRLVAMPLAGPYLSQDSPPRLHLDLDDIESETRRRIAALYPANGLLAAARQEAAAAEAAKAHENAAFARLDRVYVCSERDREAIVQRTRAEVCVLPNAVRLPAETSPSPEKNETFTFLFVGTLDYYPNRDALRSFCAETLRLILREAEMQVAVKVVGAAPPADLLWLRRVPCVQLIGQVEEVDPFYREADAVIVPLRAGGGTRIKVLEAFAHRRPVISTSIGIEGIDARDGEHVLLADTPREFARQCLRLMAEPGLGRRLAANAFELLIRAYTVEAVASFLPGSCVSRPHPTA